MTAKDLQEYARTHHHIPPEKLLAAYAGLRVEKVNPIYVDRMDLTDDPHLVLDYDLKVCGVVFGADYERKGYIQIENDDMGEYLYKPSAVVDGRPVIPPGWVNSADYEDWMNESANDLARELGWDK